MSDYREWENSQATQYKDVTTIIIDARTAQIEWLDNELKTLRAENARLREALERTLQAMLGLKQLKQPTEFHIEKWVNDGNKVLLAALEGK